MPDDRLTSEDADKKLPKPEVYIIRSGKAVFKPGMKTWFVETKETSDQSETGVVHGQTGVVVGGTFCSCNKVCSCNSVCTCESVCNCQVTCSCESVCSCQVTCSCQTTCSCQVTCSCQTTGSTYCTCNKVCSCVPVH